MWKETGINAVVAVASAIWVLAVVLLVGDAVWHGLAALGMWKYVATFVAIGQPLDQWSIFSRGLMVSNYYMPKQTPKVTAEHHGLRLVIAAADHPTDPVVYGSA